MRHLLLCLLLAGCNVEPERYVRVCAKPTVTWTVMPVQMGTAMGGLPIGGLSLVPLHGCDEWLLKPNARWDAWKAAQ